MDIPIWLAIIFSFLCLAFCAFYSATETAFACLNKYRFQAEADEGRRSSRVIVHLYEHFNSTLVSTLIGNNAASIGLSTLSALCFLNAFSGVMDDTLASLLSSIVIAFLVFLFGDTIPKFIAKRAPDTVARIVCYPMAFCVVIFYPVALFFRGMTDLLHKVFRIKEEPELAPEDLAEEIEKKEAIGDLEENESDILANSLDFADTSVKEVLTPLRKMKMVDLDGLTVSQLVDYLKTCPYSRLPIYYQSKDKVVGILVVKNFLTAYFKNPRLSILEYIQKPYFITPAIKIDDLLDGFRNHHTQIAIVRKEGKVIGMVTTEDVLEELVGEIDEEGNEAAEAKL